MKEAAGEANMTVITIVLIAIVLAVGTIIVNSVLSNTGRSSACQAAGGKWSAGVCKSGNTTLTCEKATADIAGSAKKGEWYCH